MGPEEVGGVRTLMEMAPTAVADRFEELRRQSVARFGSEILCDTSSGLKNTTKGGSCGWFNVKQTPFFTLSNRNGCRKCRYLGTLFGPSACGLAAAQSGKAQDALYLLISNVDLDHLDFDSIKIFTANGLMVNRKRFIATSSSRFFLGYIATFFIFERRRQRISPFII